MIRNTLKNTRESTFVVKIPDKNNNGFPLPNGTGFFISSTGYFITANHVVGTLNIGDIVGFLERPNFQRDDPRFVLVMGSKIINKWPKFDLALLKAEFEENKEREYFKTRSDFPYLEIDYSNQEEGTPAYAFGYPLPESDVQNRGIIIAVEWISSRVTSAIISSTTEYFGPSWTPSDPKYYVIDKALNYGNSGGPVILSETGRVISVCVRFQPQEMKDSGTIVPSLYSITSSLQNIQKEIQKL